MKATGKSFIAIVEIMKYLIITQFWANNEKLRHSNWFLQWIIKIRINK